MQNGKNVEPDKIMIPRHIQMYLNEIGDRLNQGRAAVMVGSGFSKNAVNIRHSQKRFLDWNELGDLFYQKLYGKKPDAQTSHYLDALRLAGAVESAFGRSTLDRLLLDNLPDEEYKPSQLHKVLLSLNWIDVFTTNYDTLLERTCKYVANRRYQVVINRDDLVYSCCPRIVKLHGSFPSERPFVITQEDYRRYPMDSAAFVNTVRQALLENIMCLIGFSGDDPNFISWIGWIRDCLGGSAPKIYFVTLGASSRVDDALLCSRNIAVIDLAECFPGKDVSYPYALAFFLEELQRQQIRNSWKTMFPSINRFYAHMPIKERYELWKESKACYPGWIVMPHKFRECFGRSIKEFETYPDTYKKEKSADDSFLEFMKVYDWMRKIFLFPATKRMMPFYCEAVQAVREDSCDALDLKLSMLEYYRCVGDFCSHESLLKSIQSCPNVPAQEKIRILCESTSAALWQLQLDKFERSLEEWASERVNCDMELNYIGFLWECGRYRQGIAQLVNILDELRGVENAQLNFKVLSQEAYTIQLCDIMQRVYDKLDGLTKKDAEYIKKTIQSTYNLQQQCYGISNRYDFLKLYDCDPDGELEFFCNVLSQSESSKQNEEYYYTKSVQFICFIERTGMFYKITLGNHYREALRNAICHIAKQNLYWAMILCVRTREDALLAEVLSDSAMAACSVQKISHIAERMFFNIQNSDKPLPEFGSSEYVMSHILPKLIWYCSIETREMIFNKIEKQSGNAMSFLPFLNLVQEYFSSMSAKDIKNHLDRILELMVQIVTFRKNDDLLPLIMGCDFMFYDRALFWPQNSSQDFHVRWNCVWENLMFLRTSGNEKYRKTVTCLMLLLCYLGFTEITQPFRNDLMLDIKNGMVFPPESYYYMPEFVPQDAECNLKIQKHFLNWLCVKKTYREPEMYRTQKNLCLIGALYPFGKDMGTFRAIFNRLSALKRKSKSAAQFGYLHQLLTQLLLQNGIDPSACFQDYVAQTKDNRLIGSEILSASDFKRKEIVVLKLSCGTTDAMEAVDCFYIGLKKEFHVWRDMVTQVVVLLCHIIRNEVPCAAFCVNVMREILNISDEVRKLAPFWAAAELLSFLLELPFQSDSTLLLKANAAKMAYDLSLIKHSDKQLISIVKKWEDVCASEETPALIRKQWFDNTQ